MEEDVKPEVPVAHPDGVAHEATGSRCYREGLENPQCRGRTLSEMPRKRWVIEGI